MASAAGALVRSSTPSDPTVGLAPGFPVERQVTVPPSITSTPAALPATSTFEPPSTVSDVVQLAWSRAWQLVRVSVPERVALGPTRTVELSATRVRTVQACPASGATATDPPTTFTTLAAGSP